MSEIIKMEDLRFFKTMRDDKARVEKERKIRFKKYLK